MNREEQYKLTAEKLYKMYIIKNKEDYGGSIVKCECVIDNERGLFKERMSTRSKDHIFEQIAYHIAGILNVPCCKASCRKTNDIYGSFSRFEVVDVNNITPFRNIARKDEMTAEEILNISLVLTNGSVNSFVTTLYKYIIFDYITGQQDRHNENLALYKKDNSYEWYPLYDNGLYCFSTYDNDVAKQMLHNRFYASRMGDSEDILEAIKNYRDIIYPGDMRELVKYNKINSDVLFKIIDKADKYNQLGLDRRKATIQFILNQITDIHNINMRRQ